MKFLKNSFALSCCLVAVLTLILFIFFSVKSEAQTTTTYSDGSVRPRIQVYMRQDGGAVTRIRTPMGVRGEVGHSSSVPTPRVPKYLQLPRHSTYERGDRRR